MKRCKNCNEVLTPKRNSDGTWESPSDIEARVYCDRSCYLAACNGRIQQLHMGDIASIYEARKGRRPPIMAQVLDEVQVELMRIRMCQGRGGE